ncbi:hypothetical protein RHMOL_Rhmol12G0195600 [Rhododendron molle]|uniref:Uncharacterized protein n=1 Tax=Rhododendron molle TaxID=49168 RepID=A0ACC0LKA4_RHOML|nr:hypothetical protein RHMOL_Rhmol12G0195600 [Rhododendron molle]
MASVFKTRSRGHHPTAVLSLSLSLSPIYSISMGSVFGSTAKSKEEIETALSKVKEIIDSNPVVVFSKTYCGYCKQVKQLLSKLGATYKVVELDEENDGSEMQQALAELTGQGTVPNVFIGEKHIGGCDAVLQKHQRGELVPLLTEAGAIGKQLPSAVSKCTQDR